MGREAVGLHTRRQALYLESSAIVKLAKGEDESPDAWAYLTGAARLVSSELVITEVPRALRRIAAEDREVDLAGCLRKADTLLEVIDLRVVDRQILRRAGTRFEPRLRSLDAIQVMTAFDLRPIEAFMTYDKRQAAAARRIGLPTVSPGMPK